MSTNTSGQLTNEQRIVYYDTVAAELARVTAERDTNSDAFAHVLRLEAENAALRARVAELVAVLRLALGSLEARGVSIKNAPENSQLARWHALARSESPACQNATNGGQISSESAIPAKHPFKCEQGSWQIAAARKQEGVS